MTHKDYASAKAEIPKDAKISSTFGFPGEEIYDEAWRVDGEERVWWIRKRGPPEKWSVDITFRGR